MRRALVETNLKILAKDEVQSTALDFVPVFDSGEPSAASRTEIPARCGGSPLTPLPARTGRVSLDNNADAVVEAEAAK